VHKNWRLLRVILEQLPPGFLFAETKHPDDCTCVSAKSLSLGTHVRLDQIVEHDETPLLQMLLERGADPQCSMAAFDRSPLHVAVAAGKHAAARLLLEANADTACAEKKGGGDTPLHLAAQYAASVNTEAGVVYAAAVETVQLLVRHGAPALAKNSSKKTPAQVQPPCFRSLQ
jgi:ankyrin repeat protein